MIRRRRAGGTEYDADSEGDRECDGSVGRGESSHGCDCDGEDGESDCAGGLGVMVAWWSWTVNTRLVDLILCICMVL